MWNGNPNIIVSVSTRRPTYSIWRQVLGLLSGLKMQESKKNYSEQYAEERAHMRQVFSRKFCCELEKLEFGVLLEALKP